MIVRLTVLLFLLLCGVAQAQFFPFPGPGRSGSGGGGGCAPGGPTGQMDFSVCSNIAIIAAAMP